MISKETALEQIKSKTDIPVNLSDGSIIFSYNPDNVPNIEKFRKTVSDLIKTIDYKASWGIVALKKTPMTESDSALSNPEEDLSLESITVADKDPINDKSELASLSEEKLETSRFYTEDEGGQMSLF